MMFSDLLIEYLQIKSTRSISLRKIKLLFFKIKMHRIFKRRIKNKSITSNDVKDFIACCKLKCNKDCMFVHSYRELVACKIFTTSNTEISNSDKISITVNQFTIVLSIENDKNIELITESKNGRDIKTRVSIEDAYVLKLLIDIYRENILALY